MSRRIEESEVLRASGDNRFLETARLHVIGGVAGHTTDTTEFGPLPLGVKATRPTSATTTWINLAALLSFVVATLLLATSGLSPTSSLLLSLAAPGLTIIILETSFVRSRIPFLPCDPIGYVSQPSGLSRSRRLYLKTVGLAASIAGLVVLYWLFPIYRLDQTRYLAEIVHVIWLPLLLITPFYIAFVDSRQTQPEDGYFHAGLMVTGFWEKLDRAILRQHCLQWLVKAFFLPLMLSLLAGNLMWLTNAQIANIFIQFYANPGIDSWIEIYDFLYQYLFLIDVGFAAVGYLLTLKIFDAQLRSAEPTLLGWLVCLACYWPFWGVIGTQYLNYETNTPWGFWFEHWPVIKFVWSLLILACLTNYALSTVQFGIRFSNLANRGIITNGPYRWLKHPAYISKNLSYWLVSLPFITNGSASEALRSTLLLLGVNLIYYLRAKTEEAHLRNDPVYRDYESFMQQHGLPAVLRRKWTQVQSLAGRSR